MLLPISIQLVEILGQHHMTRVSFNFVRVKCQCKFNNKIEPPQCI